MPPEPETQSVIQPLRMLEYITSGSMGGAEHGLQMEGRELIRRGHRVLFVCPRGRRLTTVLRDRGFEVWAPRTYGKIDPWTLLRLVRLIRSRKIQLVHTHLSTASLLGSLAARICQIPAIATVHGLNSAFCYRFSTRVVAVSNAVKEHLTAQGLPEGQLRVVHNGITVAHFPPDPDRAAARRALGMADNTPVLLYAGRLSPEKGVNLLPEIMERVLPRVRDAQLLILGEGALRQELEADVQSRKLSKHIRLIGYQADPRSYLAAAGVLVLPSFREGLPRILLEGMASGLPAVGTQAGGIPEALEPEVTGKIVPVGDAAALADACVPLLMDPQLRQRMGQAARTRVEQHFTVEHSISRLEAVFSEALEE